MGFRLQEKMSRVSYELSMGLLVLIQEGLGRNTHYYYEPRICTLDTENTISTLVQADFRQSNLYKKLNTELKRWHNSYAWNNARG